MDVEKAVEGQSPAVPEPAVEDKEALPTSIADNILTQTDSVFLLPEAKKLFNPFENESSTLTSIHNQIETLKQANRSSSGYIVMSVITRSGHSNKSAQNIALALQLAKENMNAWTWEHCCSIAVQRLAQQGLALATHDGRVVTKL